MALDSATASGKMLRPGGVGLSRPLSGGGRHTASRKERSINIAFLNLKQIFRTVTYTK